MTHPEDISRLHAQAMVALVNAAVAGEQQDGRYKVYVGKVTDAEADVKYPYYVIWPPPAMRPTNTMAGYDGAAQSTIQLTAAGITENDVLAALDRAAAGLHRVRPTIPGRACGAFRQVPGATPPAPLREDRVNANGQPVFVAFALFDIYSTPSTA